MRKTRLLSTVAATLLLTIGAAAAQGTKEEAPSRAPAAQQGAPAEKVAPPLHEGQRKGSQTTGQGQREMKPGDHKSPGQAQKEMKPGDRKSQTTGQSPRDSSEPGKPGKKSQSEERGGKEKPGDRKSQTTGQSPRDSSEPGKPGMKSQSEERGGKEKLGDRKSQTTGQSPRGSSETGKPGMKSQSERGEPTDERSRTTTGQGAAAGTAKLSTEQRTKITTIFNEHRVEPTRLNVSVRVGTRVPDTVRFHPLPVQVVEVYPEWRGYDYIRVGEQILVVDPDTHEIVDILDA